MKKIISSIADSYGLYDLNKKYSKNNQFYYDENEAYKLIGDYEKFYFKPDLPKIKLENGKLIFKSQVYNEECNKDAIFYTNLYSNKIKENVSVIMIHGWRSEKLNRLEPVFLNEFKKNQYNVYRYILPYHMDRCDKTNYSGEYFYSANICRTLKSIMQSVNDIRALISYLKENNNKVIIIGLSMGGLIGNLIAEYEENIDLLISIFPANNLAFTTFKSEIGKYIKRDFLEKSFDFNKLNEIWTIINPSLNRPIIDLNKILLIHGNYDKYVLYEDTQKISKNWGIKNEQLKCGHSGIVINKKEIRNKVIDFINKEL